MQPFLLPDYLDRSKKTKNENLANLVLCCQMVDYIRPISVTEMMIEFPAYPEPLVDGFNLKQLVPLINSDESMQIFLRTYKAYREKPHKNYVIEKNLVKALAGTKLDIKSKYLPKEFTAFIDFKDLKDNDGDDIKGVFVNITQEEEWMLYLGIINYTKDPEPHFSVSHLNIPIDETDKPISEIIKSYEQVYSSIRPDILERYKSGGVVENFEGLYKMIFQGGYHNYLHAILNSILYIHNSPELCIEKENLFSNKKSKREAQKNIYTSKKYVVLGKNYSFPNEYTCGEVGVSGHWRWQPHGPSWSMLKHIFIHPHTRNYDKNSFEQGDSDCPKM